MDLYGSVTNQTPHIAKAGMIRRTSTSKTKDNGRAGDGPEGRPSNRPRYQPRSRPIGRVVARPKGAIPCRGGRGGSTSASRNVDWFADDRGDVGEYLDESLRPEGRPPIPSIYQSTWVQHS
ncbi:hypothetical protein Tco_0112055 [Tanacetum coccineum]